MKNIEIPLYNKVCLFKISILYCIVVFFYSSNSYSGTLNDSLIEKRFSQISKLKSAKTLNSLKESFDILNKTELEILQKNDTLQILYFNRRTIEFFFGIRDFEITKEYFNSSIKILKKYKNNRELGLLYESLSIYYENTNHDEALKYLIKGKKTLKKYGTAEDNIDINYNYSLINIRDGHWNQAILGANSSIHFISISNKKQNQITHLYLFLIRAYTEINDIDQAKLYIEKVKKDKYFDLKDIEFATLYYRTLGRYNTKINNLKLANEEYELSQKYADTLNKARNRMKEFSSSIKLDLLKKGHENEKIKQDIKYKNFILILEILVIITLILLLFFLYRNLKYKTEINKLLNKSNILLQKANNKLNEALDVKKNFLDSITHELRTPLNTIKGVVYLMKSERPPEEEQKKHIETLDFYSNHLLSLIDDVIDYNSLSKTKKIDLKFETTNLKQFLEKMVTSLSTNSINNNEIIFDYDDKIPTKLEIDIAKLSQVFIHLITNAQKFTSNGKIFIKAKLETIEKNNAIIYFEVKDNGIGISSKDKNKIFSVFFQEHQGLNKEYTGTGLGLSIVKRIIELFGSKINFESELGNGTTFYFKIPFKIDREEEKLVSIFNDKPIILQKNCSILLVEDNKVNQLMTKKILSNFGYMCEVANNGKEAVDMVNRKDYSLVLMDIMMPVMNGFEATQIIHQNKPHIPIIALSAISKDINKKSFKKAKFLEILNKPTDPDILNKIILKSINSK